MSSAHVGVFTRVHAVQIASPLSTLANESEPDPAVTEHCISGHVPGRAWSAFVQQWIVRVEQQHVEILFRQSAKWLELLSLPFHYQMAPASSTPRTRTWLQLDNSIGRAR
jgi:hypothetical protein